MGDMAFTCNGRFKCGVSRDCIIKSLRRAWITLKPHERIKAPAGALPHQPSPYIQFAPIMPLLKVGKAASTVAESIHEAEGITAATVNPKLNEGVTSTEAEEPAATPGQPQGWIPDAEAPIMVQPLNHQYQ